MKIYYLTLVLCFLNCSCQTSSEEKNFYKVCEQLSIPIRHNSYYLLIPIDGCGVCLKKSIEFSKKNISNQNIITVLVSTSGRKNAVIKYGGLMPSSIFIDEKGMFINAKICNGYVSVVSISDHNPFKIEFFEPKNIDSGLSKLYKYSITM